MCADEDLEGYDKMVTGRGRRRGEISDTGFM